MSVFFLFLIVLEISPGYLKLAQSVHNLELILNLQKYFDSKLLVLLNEPGHTPNLLFKRLAFKLYITVFTSQRYTEFFFRISQTLLARKTLLLINESSNFETKLIWLQNLKFTHPPTWIRSENRKISENLKNTNSLVNCNIILIKKNLNHSTRILKFNQASKNSIDFTTFATWKNKTLSIHESKKSLSKIDLQGQNFNIAKSTFKGYEDEYQKLWVLFSEAMNFTITWVTAPAGGVLLPNGTKTGVYKMLEEHLVDGTPSNFVVTNSRLDVYDFIWPAQMTTTKIYVALDQELNWSSFVAPFHGKIWLLLIIWIILSSIVNYFVTHVYCYKENNPIFNSFKALCYQCRKTHGNTLSYYISYLMPYVLAVVVIQHYSAALHSFLTVDKFELPFNDMEGFVHNGKYKLSVQNKTYAWFYFNTDNGTQTEKIRNGSLVSPEKLPENSTVGFRQICRHRWIFVTITEGIKVRGECPIGELKTSIFSTSNGILVRKDFPQVKEMLKLMKHLQFAGLVRWKHKNEILSNKDNNSFEPLALKIIFPVFLFLTTSLGLSILILFLERIY